MNSGQLAARPKETVVLLHGIAGMKWNMLSTQQFLRRQGYETLNTTYPSLGNHIQALADFLHQRFLRIGLWERPKVHFVTHSLGGLVTRHYLDHYKAQIPADRLGRVVMMGPPNGGSEVADLLCNFPLYRWIYGPAGQQLTTVTQSDAAPEPYYEVGIIAGTRGWPYILGNIAIRGQHDGRVAVEKTKLRRMTDHVVLNATHGFMPMRPDAHRQIAHFLKHGQVARAFR